MKKPFTKIICAALSTVVALGTVTAAGCSAYFGGSSLGGNYSAGEVNPLDNGGFVVEKGEYVYFINGVEGNTADNKYGEPVRGAVMRISASDLDAHNYSNTETVVPLVTYSGSKNAGIFVYGDYIYYSTPNTTRNSDGVIQNSQLDLKRSKLDGTEAMKDAYVTFKNNSYEYRYVEVNNVVYILYVATNEKLYEESSGVTNIHSYNTSTGEDTVLAYNVLNVLFDAEDKTNPRVYYTMRVTDYASGSAYGYNQVYTVTADDTTPNEYDTEHLLGWDDEEDRYENYGDIVFDGIGHMSEATPFNYDPTGEQVNNLSYTYALETYRNGKLFYTRSSSNNSAQYLFSFDDKNISSSWNAVAGNPDDSARMLDNGTYADSYKYIFGNDGELSAVIIAENGGGITINHVDGNGKLQKEVSRANNYYYILKEGSATLLLIDGNYLYYSLSGGNGYTFYRVDYTGDYDAYDGMAENDDTNDYRAVRILDLDSVSDWFMPELVRGQLLFASETDNMSIYNYVMACDLRGTDGKVMDNAGLKALLDKYNGIVGRDGIIAGFADTDDYPSDIYANLSDALTYLFYTGDIDYVKDLAAAYEKKLAEDEDEDADPVYSANTLAKLEEFLAPSDDNAWADYQDTRKVNGEDVYSNRRDYYYSLLGTMSENDAENYLEATRADNLRSYPELEENTWWSELSQAAQIAIIVGASVIGALIVAGVIVGVVLLVRRKRSVTEEPARKRIKVDTTDDKNINVYEYAQDGK